MRADVKKGKRKSTRRDVKWYIIRAADNASILYGTMCATERATILNQSMVIVIFCGGAYGIRTRLPVPVLKKTQTMIIIHKI